MNEIYDATLAAFREANLTDHVQHLHARMQEAITAVANEMQRPSAIYRPALSPDGDKWCALYGLNLQEGVAGFGDTPDAAMRAFDAAWVSERCGPPSPSAL